MRHREAAVGSRVVHLAAHRRKPSPTRVPGEPVAFGVELPARGDLVFSVAALTQLITIADQAGLDAADDLGRAIDDLRRRLRAHEVSLPAALEEMLASLADRPGSSADIRALRGGDG